MRPSRFDCAVVGGGVAGLTIAEHLARRGASVALVERTAELGGGGTANIQGWFHSGALYAALGMPVVAKLGLANLQAMQASYGSRIHGRDAGWFTAPIRVLRDSVKDQALLTAHQRAALAAGGEAAFSAWTPIGPVESKAGPFLTTTDRVLDGRRMLSDLLYNFECNNGETFLRAEVLNVSHNREGAWRVEIHDGRRIVADKLVLAIGGEREIAPTRLRTTPVISPLLIAPSSLGAMSTVTISHDPLVARSALQFHGEKPAYQVIGGGVNLALDDTIGRLEVETRLRAGAQVAGLHSYRIVWGIKNLPLLSGRQYQPTVHVSNNCIVQADPGKFSFSPLLANMVAETLDLNAEPDKPFLFNSTIDERVAQPLHGRAAEHLFAERVGATDDRNVA